VTIFVAIASYRDADLANTIADCVARARWPEKLHFGICWQYARGDPPPPEVDKATLRQIDVPWKQSKGACWARDQALSLYQGEDFLFQIDSHHRFVKHWDALLISQIEACQEAKPLLTAYAQAFDPAEILPAAGLPTMMLLNEFTEQGIPTFAQAARPEWRGGPPQRARFLSGHFIFTLGQFVHEVPYDPDLYFIGEEISLAVRAFTHGYSLLHPSEHVMWHEYSRKQRVMHWDDHQSSAYDSASLNKVRQILTGDIAGRYGLGMARSLAEYEKYAGIDFAAGRASGGACKGTEPPQAPPPGEDVGPVRQWNVCVKVDRSKLPPAALDRPAFWYVGFFDAAGVEVARADSEREELQALNLASADLIRLERKFYSARVPVRWEIVPTDRNRNWLSGVSGGVENPPLTKKVPA
tara:strand:+ start:16714 stop:17946 length:1233 start_codon:yes stop_codon:yes gene_type:complete